MQVIRRLSKLFSRSITRKDTQSWVYRLNNKCFTQKWMTCLEYRQSNPSSWTKIYEESNLTWEAPKFYDKSYGVDLQNVFHENLPEFGILKVKEGRILGRDGWIFGKENCLLPEFSKFDKEVGNIRLPKVEPIFQKVPGKCLSITSTYSGNYFHFLVDSLPKLHLFHESGHSFSDVEKIYTPLPRSEHSELILDKLGIPREKIIWADKNTAIAADEVISPSFVGRFKNYPKWLSAFYREYFKFSGLSKRRRIYLNRKGLKRNLENENKLVPVLEKYGFENYSPDSSTEQWKDFQEAEFIIAPHGAALSNMVFCRPGTKILEIIPSDQIRIYFYSLARACDLEYGYLAGESINHRQNGHGPSPYDFRIRPEQLENALEGMLQI